MKRRVRAKLDLRMRNGYSWTAGKEYYIEEKEGCFIVNSDNGEAEFDNSLKDYICSGFERVLDFESMERMECGNV